MLILYSFAPSRGLLNEFSNNLDSQRDFGKNFVRKRLVLRNILLQILQITNSDLHFQISFIVLLGPIEALIVIDMLMIHISNLMLSILLYFSKSKSSSRCQTFRLKVLFLETLIIPKNFDYATNYCSILP